MAPTDRDEDGNPCTRVSGLYGERAIVYPSGHVRDADGYGYDAEEAARLRERAKRKEMEEGGDPE